MVPNIVREVPSDVLLALAGAFGTPEMWGSTWEEPVDRQPPQRSVCLAGGDWR